MSGAKPQPARVSAPAMRGRSPLAHLVHALNQPLTGLQCSMELAVAGPRPAGYYVRTLQEGLDLVSRMRVLTEALRELAEVQASGSIDTDVRLDEIFREIASEFEPIAEAKDSAIRMLTDEPILVRGGRAHISKLVRRLLDAVLGLSLEGEELKVVAGGQGDVVRIEISWVEPASRERVPFSPAELGLLIAKAEWEQAGAIWTEFRTERSSRCEVQMPLIQTSAGSKESIKGDVR